VHVDTSWSAGAASAPETTLVRRPGSVPAMSAADGRVTYLLVDGENIDTTLGVDVLGHKPQPEQRPRWERVRDYAAELWDQPVVPLFFLNASSGYLPTTFIQALLAMQYRPIPLAGEASEKVVDVGIQRTLDAIAARDGDVLLASHDADFVDHVGVLLDAGRRVGILGFREFVSTEFAELRAAGLELHDLEDDVRCFNAVLPRVRIIQLADFDPTSFL
jgi:putative heme uptake system protein